MKDIHRSRLDVKRLFALFQFFDVANSGGFERTNHENKFKELYKRSGRIREIQVSFLTLDRFNSKLQPLEPFIKYMLDEESRQVEKLIKVIRKFDEEALQKTDRAVKKAIERINPAKMVLESNKFLRDESNKIEGLLEKMDDPRKVHDIRKVLKSMSTICTLLLSMQQDEHIDKIVSSVNQTEMIIGEWHDNRVLIDFFSAYQKKQDVVSEPVMEEITRISEHITSVNSMLIEKLVPAIKKIVVNINPGSNLKEDLMGLDLLGDA